MVFRLLAALAFAAFLSGCARPVVETTGPLAVREVSVSAIESLKPETDILSLVRQTVPSQIIGISEGKATKVEVTLVLLAYKNPLMSLLAGDANKLGATVVLRDTAGTELSRFNVLSLDQTLVNGIAGAMLSIAQDRARVDRALARDLASTIEKRIYGQTSRPVMVPELAAPFSRGQAASPVAPSMPPEPHDPRPASSPGAGV
ncbi:MULTISPECIES: hypothetical protein [unclassified Aureimonas]|uniref:hypothetical protein n=1 Tax=unclassified Aureimonas TaxID=2615206 RepID=UPI00071FCA7E|nr:MULTISPECIES: hypothetical protein [unclassified Aureimonas]ALN71747.1 hypothetical protein M673_03420 [Aureimonas sp. AU20]